MTSLQNNSIEVELYQSYAAGETEVSIFGLVGIQTTIVIKASDTTVSATNPSYTMTGYLESHTPINASLGELSTVSLVFNGGNLFKSTSPA